MPMLVLSPPTPVKHSTNNTSNHTLVPRGSAALDLTDPAYPYNSRARRWKIGGIFGGLRYISADGEEFHGTFIIEVDDPNAIGFAGRLAGGGSRADISGNR
jgi:hypothetical protein